MVVPFRYLIKIFSYSFQRIKISKMDQSIKAKKLVYLEIPKTIDTKNIPILTFL